MTDSVKFIGKKAKVKEAGGAWVIEFPRTLTHFHTYGELTPYFKGLTEGKLMGTRCTNPGCPISKGKGEIFIPPRADCPDCLGKMEWVEMPNPVTGKIYSYTKVMRGGTGLEISTPYFQIDVMLEGVCTIPKGYLVNAKEPPKLGQKVKAFFRKGKSASNTCLDVYWKLV
jgi:uncharacterized protein